MSSWIAVARIELAPCAFFAIARARASTASASCARPARARHAAQVKQTTANKAHAEYD